MFWNGFLDVFGITMCGSVMQQKLGLNYKNNAFVSYLFERILANYDRDFVVF